MKRKIIRQGNNAYTVTLPISWIKKNSLTPKDELDVSEHGRVLKVYCEGGSERHGGKLDITNYDASSIWHAIRSFYEKGTYEFILNFDNIETLSYKDKEKVRTAEVIQESVNKLIGIEVIDRTKNSVTIKEIAESSFEEFYPTLRRIFLLLIKLSEDFSEGVREYNLSLLKTIESQHDTISKFISLCLRLINKIGHPEPIKTTFYYRVLVQLHEITDIYKFTSLWISVLNGVNKKLKEQICDVIDKTNNSLKLFYELFYKYESKKLIELSKEIVETREKVNNLAERASSYDVMVLARIIHVTYILEFLIESKIALEF